MKRGEEKRQAKRKHFDAKKVCFLGSCVESNICFEYVLLDLSRIGVRIGVSSSKSDPIEMKKGDTVRFHLPLEIENYFYDQGNVVWTGFDEHSQMQTCGISVSSQSPLPITLGAELKGDLFLRSVKDLADLKGSILAYLTHLRPHPGEGDGGVAQQKPLRADRVLQRLEEKVFGQKKRLEELAVRLDRTARKRTNPRRTGIDGIKRLAASDVSSRISVVLSGVATIGHYLEPIRILEYRLYTTYNLMAMLFLNTL